MTEKHESLQFSKLKTLLECKLPAFSVKAKTGIISVKVTGRLRVKQSKREMKADLAEA